MSGLTKREARRERNRADFIRATEQSISEHGIKMQKGMVPHATGITHGKSMREHQEDYAFEAVKNWYMAKSTGVEAVKLAQLRGIMRGAIVGLLIHIDSYAFTDERRDDMIKKLERRVLNDVKEELGDE